MNSTVEGFTAIGIDPGLAGGVAFISRLAGVAGVIPMPVRATGKGSGKEVDAWALWEWLANVSRAQSLVCVEKVHAMRKPGPDGQKGVQGVTSAFTFGMGYGKVLAVVEILKLPAIHVPPQTWQKLILKGHAKGKQAAISYCLRRYPDVSLLRTSKSRCPSDGLADALCLAEFALRQGGHDADPGTGPDGTRAVDAAGHV